MRYFKLKIVLLLMSLVMVSASAAIIFSKGEVALGILVSLILPILIIVNINQINKLINIMSSFVRGLEMNDTSMRFDADKTDTELYEMSQSMNRITSLYIKNKQELETRKLYYDRILRVMTHEMRNAIAPIVALSSDMKDNPDNYGESETSEAVDIIKSQSEGIKRFLDSYHALTHLPAPEPEPIDASIFFNRLKKTVGYIEEALFSTTGVIVYNISSGVVLNIDESLMTQVLTNLLKNSLEAMKEKGAVSNNDNGDSYSASATVTVTRNGNGALITIEDNGNGLSHEIANNPFQPFVTTKESGSGIGLFLSRQIIRMHGGDIKLHNKPGKGLLIQIGL